jgi:hypothetical protein
LPNLQLAKGVVSSHEIHSDTLNTRKWPGSAAEFPPPARLFFPVINHTRASFGKPACPRLTVSQISAAGNDMVFAVAAADNSVWVCDRNWTWYNSWASSGNWGTYNGWHPLYGTAASPYHAPLAG